MSDVNRLLWLDMEMTGLDVNKEVPIEVAAIVTDLKLNSVSDFHHDIIKQPQKYLDAMDEWNTTHHGSSGLLDKIPNGTDPSEADKKLAGYIKTHFGDEKAILCGNSISQDKKFIDHHMPKTSELLHYRILDVTSWKIMMEYSYGIKHEKKEAHRATDDIQESIDELKTYLKYVSL